MKLNEYISHNVTSEEQGIRLDRWLTRYFPNLSHGCIQKNLRHKKIRVNDKKSSAEVRLNTGDRVSLPRSLIENLSSPKPPLSDSAPQPALVETARTIASWVIYQDDSLLLLNKPQGLATQGGTGLKTSVDQALNLWLAPEGKKAYLVHRLDKDTSGLLLVAPKPLIATQLGILFKNHTVQKCYWAVGVGELPAESGRHEMWMAKRPGRAGEKMEVVSPDTPGALKAVCAYRTRAFSEGLSLVELRPQTGRTHQLRLQMAELGCPILGDGKYGGTGAHPFGRQTVHLHARTLAFTHPETGEELSFEAPLPPHFQETVEKRELSVGVSDTTVHDTLPI